MLAMISIGLEFNLNDVVINIAYVRALEVEVTRLISTDSRSGR